ncbi:hypothetical protein N7481_004545 [Penicillium waksmanii]|uniref:uncharacterized protein n=1 Tax=Penicillium waksmanii TaxID=69791 RepID=UPI002547442A|nr:uncharacterized protein N7481_004545 [Penicillium waksmanii]KAJ5989335.1 hypothetical protein N7481_004545 [Penicillium waksmanii]
MSPRSPQSLDSPNGAALTWIFDHCLRYPASYEIPLRDMYTFNCNPTNTPFPRTRSPETAFSPRNSASTHSSRSSNGSFDAAADFRSLMSHQIANRSSQPCELPVSFLTGFVHRCFTAELESVDFPQALTAIDYLKDLETRWKKEMEAALTRLGIKREDAENPNSSGFAGKYPGVMTWLHTMNAKARTVTALYTQIYVGLRRWVLINDMLLEPQNKTQRDGFFRYINAVAMNGKEALDPVIVQGAPEGEATSWGPLHDCLVRYVDHVNELINECLVVTEPSYLSEAPPHFPIPKAHPAKTGSFLERIAREVRSLGPNARTKNLKKMKSTTALDSRPGSQQSSAESSFFEIDEQKRRRLLGEATSRKISQS